MSKCRGLFILFLLLTLTAVHHPPLRAATPLIRLPINQPVLKINIRESTLYEITAADLASADFPLAGFNPNHLQLIHRGHPAAVQFIGDDDDNFEAGEIIRFYGWAFDGSRYEKQFIEDNVFWLWSGESSSDVQLVPNRPAGHSNPIRTSRQTVTIEPENDFFSSWTDQWPTFANEPDAWYWDRIPRSGSTAVSQTNSYSIGLPLPAAAGEEAILTTEWMSRARGSSPGSVSQTITVKFNGSQSHTLTWSGRRSVNLTQTVPAALLADGANELTAVVNTDDVLYFNRATITYTQQLKLMESPLIFQNGTMVDMVIDVESTAVEDLTLWDISNRYAPKQMTLSNSDLGPGGLRLGQSSPDLKKYLLMESSQFKTPAISSVILQPIDPESLAAEWLTITHPDLRTSAEYLAAFRQTKNQMSTHMVDIEQIINQFGYGFPLPSAMRDYLSHAHHNWSTPPRFLLLLGDATINPRQLDCAWSCQNSAWDATEPTFIPTDLQFVDRFQGLIPTDQTIGMLDDDLLPDVMIGRIAAQTIGEAEAAVAKIIEYELETTLARHPDRNILFLADNSDAAGDFCFQNQTIGNQLPPHISHRSYCLPTDPNAKDVASIQQQIFQQINDSGAYLLNYRGHGSVQVWGGSGEILMSVAPDSSLIGSWLNAYPTVILSADCLDGHFAWPGLPSLSETLLTLPHSGTAAHWSSSGLGADQEHSVMQAGFYHALFSGNGLRIGEAISQAQVGYANSGAHPAPLYSFTLQGDPAMPLKWAHFSRLTLPIVVGD